MSNGNAKRRINFLLYGLLLNGLLLTGTSYAQLDISVSDAWVRIPPPGMKMMAGYGMLTNKTSSTIELVAAQSDSFESIGFHISEIVDGISSMRELDAITLLPGESVTFEPGGRHLMIYTPQYEAQPESVQIEFLDRSGSVYSTTFDLLKNGPE